MHDFACFFPAFLLLELAIEVVLDLLLLLPLGIKLLEYLVNLFRHKTLLVLAYFNFRP